MDGGSTLVKGRLNVNAVRMKSILTSLTGAYTISALEQHQFNVIRAAFRFTFSSPMVSNDRKRIRVKKTKTAFYYFAIVTYS